MQLKHFFHDINSSQLLFNLIKLCSGSASITISRLYFITDRFISDMSLPYLPFVPQIKFTGRHGPAIIIPLDISNIIFNQPVNLMRSRHALRNGG